MWKCICTSVSLCLRVFSQDAHEMFQVLTETLDEEATRFPRVLPLFDLCGLQVSGL